MTVQHIYSWRNPFCESVINILGLAELGDLLSKDDEDSPRGIARLKAGKERIRCQVFLGVTFVGFQRCVENGYKVGLEGGCGRDNGHDGS